MAATVDGLSIGPVASVLDHCGRHALGLGHHDSLSRVKTARLEGFMIGAQLALDLAAAHPEESAWIARRLRIAILELDQMPAWQSLVAQMAGVTRRAMTEHGE
jgi:hypothetical protein